MTGAPASDLLRSTTKRLLARSDSAEGATGATLLIYHRVGGGTVDELDLTASDFVDQLDVLDQHEVLDLDRALDRLANGDDTACVVLTFDDGFSDVYDNAWPHLRERSLPFTIYLASAYMDREMRWPGSTARGACGRGMTWRQLDEMVSSGLCTIGNHTHTHVPASQLSVDELDRCTAVIEQSLGVRARHFTYPWGTAVPQLEPALRQRFRSASTGTLGRNQPGDDPIRLRRVPVRRTDPLPFFRAKVAGTLRAERAYGRVVATAKGVSRLTR